MKLQDTGKTKEQIQELYNTYFHETFKRLDFIADHGEGAYVYDENNRPYLDFMAGIAVNSTGHCNERVTKAIIDQCQSMIHASNYCYTVPQALTAELICKSIGMEKIYFQNSGAEANEVMIKLGTPFSKEINGSPSVATGYAEWFQGYVEGEETKFVKDNKKGKKIKAIYVEFINGKAIGARYYVVNG